MPVPPQPSAPPPPAQLAALVGDAWRDEGATLLPPDLAALARAVGAFRRVRAIATGRSTRILEGRDQTRLARRVRFTRVYVQQEGRWRVAAAQATPLA